MGRIYLYYLFLEPNIRTVSAWHSSAVSAPVWTAWPQWPDHCQLFSLSWYVLFGKSLSWAVSLPLRWHGEWPTSTTRERRRCSVSVNYLCCDLSISNNCFFFALQNNLLTFAQYSHWQQLQATFATSSTLRLRSHCLENSATGQFALRGILHSRLRPRISLSQNWHAIKGNLRTLGNAPHNWAVQRCTTGR